MTMVTETLTMAGPPKGGVPLLISVKAVDPAVYPFYGGEVFTAHEHADRDRPRQSRGGRWRAPSTQREDRRHHSHRRTAVSHLVRSHQRARPDDRQHQRRSAHNDVARIAGQRPDLLVPGSRAAERFLFRLPPAMPLAPVREQTATRVSRRPDCRLFRSASAHRTGAAAVDHVSFAGEPGGAGDRRAGRCDSHSGASAAEDGFHRDHEVHRREIGAGAAHLHDADSGPGAGGQLRRASS